MIKVRDFTKEHRHLHYRLRVLIILVLILVLLSLLAPFLEPNDPGKTNALLTSKGPSDGFPLGTDRYGRCVLSRVMAGAQTSIFAATTLVFIMFAVGTAVGILCGYYGGIVDNFFMRLADIFLAFPQMVLAIAVAGILGGGLGNAMLALGITGWTLYARLARSAVMAMKEEPFVLAAKLSGSSDFRIMFKQLLPNVIGPLAVNATTQIGTTMIGLAGLSFLGVGVSPSEPEWGSMINQNRAFMQLSPWAVLVPAGAIVLTVMVFNYLGDTIRDWMDVKNHV